jgi:putative transposase
MPWKDSSVVGQRAALVRALLNRREPVAQVCDRFGISRQTGHKFLRRFAAQGRAGLVDGSRRPQRGRSEQGARWWRRVLRLRRTHPTWGARKLRWLLQRRFRGEGVLPAERTLQRWIARAGLARVPRARPRRVLPGAGAHATPARRANDVWTIDLKGWFRTADGQKVEPLTMRDQWSRFILWSQPLAPRDERGVRRVCQRLFRRHGVPRTLRCDRGNPFFGDGPCGFTRLSLWWWRLGIRVEFVRRGRVDNNAHEQMHRVLKAETIQPAARSVLAQARRLARWRWQYNHARPHEALGLRPPATRYHPAPAALSPLRLPRYPAHWLVRRVRANGEIHLPGWGGSIGRAFAGLPVGLAPRGAQCYRVYFATLCLGELDLAGLRKLRITPF